MFKLETTKDKIKEAEKQYNAATMSSVLLFSKSGSKYADSGSNSGEGRRNNHDFAAGVDVSIKDEFIRNGADNFLPFLIMGAVKRSTIQKRAFKTITNVASGEMTFVNLDGTPVSDERKKYLKAVYKSLGITRRDFLFPSVCSAYLYGGTPVTMSWTSNGREWALSAVQKRDYKSFRLSAPIMKDGRNFYDKHYFHQNWGFREEAKNKKVKVSKKTKSWLAFQRDQKKAKDAVVYINSYDSERKLSSPVNRTQSFFIKDLDGLSDHYPLPSWFSGAAFNYIKSDFLLSCFDVDDIENGFHASGFVKVYHKSYKNPESGEAKTTFEEHKKQVEERFRGAYNSGALAVIPVDIEGKPTSDFMEFVPTPSTSSKERHTILDKRIEKNILSANGAIYSELFGIRDEKSVLSEGDGKLSVGLRILNQFTIKPLVKMFDDDEGGFLNMINDILGIEERTKIVPNLSAFLDIDKDLAKHFLHPDQWFGMFKDFGLNPPTEEQINDGLIPAYQNQGGKTSITVNNG